MGNSIFWIHWTVNTICHHSYFVSDAITSPAFLLFVFFWYSFTQQIFIEHILYSKHWFLFVYCLLFLRFLFSCVLFTFLKKHMFFVEPVWVLHFRARGFKLPMFVINCVVSEITSFSLFCFLNLCSFCISLFSIFYPINFLFYHLSVFYVCLFLNLQQITFKTFWSFLNLSLILKSIETSFESQQNSTKFKPSFCFQFLSLFFYHF